MMVKFTDLFSFTAREVRFTFNNATKVASTAGLTLLKSAPPEKPDHAKLLIVVPKHYGNAIARNLIRRQFKAIFYEERLFEQAANYILLVRRPAINLRFAQLKEFLISNIS